MVIGMIPTGTSFPDMSTISSEELHMNIKTALLTAACALALSACGDGPAPQADPAATPAPEAPATAPAQAPVETTPAEMPAQTPAETTTDTAAAPAVTGCAIEVDSNDAMQYNVKSITVPASCDEFTINLNHVGKMPVAAMGHNVVVTTQDDMQAVAADGMAAGLDVGYVKPDDDRVIAKTDMIGGGESTSVTFDVSDLDGDYKFFCSFPGHAALMNGTLTVE